MTGMEDVLAAHLIGGETEGMGDFTYLCTCGHDDGTADDWGKAAKLFAAHVAEALTLAGFGNLHDAWDAGYFHGWDDMCLSGTAPNPYPAPKVSET